MIQITLGRKKLTDPRTEWLQRSQIGWEEGLPEQQLFDIARGVWALGKKAWHERYAVVSGAGTVRQAIEIHQVLPDNYGRYFFEGRILQPGDPVSDLYVGKDAPNGSQQNPITYFKSPFDCRVCACNCGTPINRGDFLPGHDQRAIHERIAQVGTVKDFITWFDTTWPGSAAPEPTRLAHPTEAPAFSYREGTRSLRWAGSLRSGKEPVASVGHSLGERHVD